jgi:pimeloyl-ACP methyl ester carboxylesterase
MMPEQAVKRGYADTKYGQIHYYSSGSEGPLMFLFHETALSGSEFVNSLPILGSGCRAVALDTPGYGMSYAPSAPLSIEELSEQLASAIRQFGDGPYILVGVHTGSTLALELATRTLRGDVAQVVFSGLSLLTTDEISQFQRILSDPVIDKEGNFLITEWRKRRRRWGVNVELADILWGTVEQLRVYERFHWALDAVFKYDAASALEKLDCPAFFLTGQYDSLIESDKRAVDCVVTAKLKILQDVGGRLPYLHPQLYAQNVLKFVDLC